MTWCHALDFAVLHVYRYRAECPHDGNKKSETLPSKEIWLKKCWKWVYIYCSCSICCIWCHCFVFYHYFGYLHKKKLFLFLNQNTWREMTLGLFTLTTWTSNFCFNYFLVSTSLFAVKQFQNDEYICKLPHAKTFKLKLKMSSFIFRWQAARDEVARLWYASV